MATSSPNVGGAAGATGSAKNSMTPGFLGGAGGGEKPVGLNARNEKGASVLGAAEKAAAGADISQNNDDLDGAREDEENVGSVNYTGSGREEVEEKQGQGFFSNHKGPVAGVILSLALLIVMMAPAGSPLLGWAENITSMFGQSSAVMNRRSNFMINRLLKTNASTTKNTFLGSQFNIKNSKLISKLKSQNINYVETTDASGNKINMMVYESPDGKVVPIVASDGDVPRANSLQGAEVDVGNGRRLTINSEGMTLSKARSSNPDFNTRYDAATITLTGRIAGWFDGIADAMFTRLVGRNARNQTDMDGEYSKEKADEILFKNRAQGENESEMDAENMKKNDNGEYDTKKITDSDGDLIDSNGKKIVDPTSDAADATIKVSEVTGAAAGDDSLKVGKNSAQDVGNSLKAKAAKISMMASSTVCGVLKSVSAISLTVGAISVINSIGFAAVYLEIASKIKDGRGDELTHEASNQLYAKTKTYAYDPSSGESIDVNGSIVDSPGWNTVFSDKNLIDENSPEAMMVNRENAAKIALRNVGLGGALSSFATGVAALGGGVAAFRACNGIQAIAGFVDGASDVILAFGTFGVGNFVKEIIKGAVKGLAIAGTMTAMFVIIGIITPVVSTWLASSLQNLVLGKIGGYVLNSGAQNIFNSNLAMSTGRYATRDNAVEIFGMTKDVEKEWAAYERATRSPFDTTSKYTFLGSIVNSFTPINNSSGNNILSPISSTISLAGSSVLAMVNPSAKAASESNSFAQSLASEENCPTLSSVGVAGDFACNKHVGAYVNELTTMDPDDNYKWMKEHNSFVDEDDESGNPKVDKDSDYFKYIVACVANDSQPGAISGAVEGAIYSLTTTDNDVVNGMINIGMNFVPFSGFLDSLTAAEMQANYKWNSGLACTGNSGDSELDEAVKHYSIYNLDQRVLEGMGIIEKSSTLASLEDYYENNPIDNSLEGKIARFSGQTKEEVAVVLDALEYVDYIANYNPSERYAFGQEIRPAGADELKFDNDQKVAYVILLNTIEFADVRNRSFVV